MRLDDHLAEGPRSASELTAITRANPRALHRFLRTLASLGILTQDSSGRFAPPTPRRRREQRCAGRRARDRPRDGGTRIPERLCRVPVFTRNGQERGNGVGLRHAATALDRIHADDYLVINNLGQLHTKAQVMSDVRAGAFKYQSMEHKGVVMRVYGDVAIVNAQTNTA
jgi:hypothetical protein